ncbi:hypothetical protein ACTNEA_08625 [Oscillospiraceae bacterium HCP3S3_F4]
METTTFEKVNETFNHVYRQMVLGLVSRSEIDDFQSSKTQNHS